MMKDSLLTAGEVARLLSIQPSTVYAGVARGLIPCVRLWQGRNRALLRFRREDIDRLIREGARRGSGENHPEGGGRVRRA